MNSNNSINQSGNVGRVNYCPPSGDMQAALFFSLGVTRYPGRKLDNGEYDTTTDWIDCVIYGKRAEKINEKSIIAVGTGLSVLGSHRSHREEFVVDGKTTSRNISQVLVEDFQVTRFADSQKTEAPEAAAATA